MNPALQLLYSGAAQLADALAWASPPLEHKVLRALRARRGLTARYARWARSGRARDRALLWMHAPSVGEGLQARPVLALARARRPDLQLAYTFFSPSAKAFARTVDADFRAFLPFDTRRNARRILRSLHPSALVFSKLDVWPNLVTEAQHRSIRLGLISATFAASSGRAARIARVVLRDAYRRLDAVGAIDDEDAERLVSLGVRRDVLTVTGDTRYDQVWERAQGISRDEPLLAPLRSTRPTLVAGSTWPADERPLLSAWEMIRRRVGGARLIIAPHEPTSAHLEPIISWAAARQIPLARVGEAGISAEVILVDRVGVLGSLYALADVAFVGGGFHEHGLHSVLEPAAFGAPVIFGPQHAASRDARLLLRGGGFSVDDAGTLGETLLHLFEDERARRSAGEAARRMVRDGLGAAERSWALVSALLPAPPRA